MIKRVIGYAAVLLLMIYLFFMYDDRVISIRWFRFCI